MNKLSAPDGVVRTYLTAKSIDGHDGDAVRIRVDQGQRRQLEWGGLEKFLLRK